MAFMQPQVYRGHYYEVQHDHGSTTIVPEDVVQVGDAATWADFQDYVEGPIDNPDEDVTPDDLQYGWLARLSAPGYLDCTDWTAHTSEKQAREYLRETYDLEDDEVSE